MAYTKFVLQRVPFDMNSDHFDAGHLHSIDPKVHKLFHFLLTLNSSNIMYQNFIFIF